MEDLSIYLGGELGVLAGRCVERKSFLFLYMLDRFPFLMESVILRS